MRAIAAVLNHNLQTVTGCISKQVSILVTGPTTNISFHRNMNSAERKVDSLCKVIGSTTSATRNIVELAEVVRISVSDILKHGTSSSGPKSKIYIRPTHTLS